MIANHALAPAHMLLVEDNPADVRLVEIALEEAELQNPLSVVTNGEDAISYLKKEGRYGDAPVPDLVLLDLNLPRKSGYDVLTEMRNHPLLAEIPTIVLSGSVQPASATPTTSSTHSFAHATASAGRSSNTMASGPPTALPST